MEQNKDTFFNYYGNQTERQDPPQQYLRMSATYFPYYPQPQYAVPSFYGSQLQGAQEIHSSSVQPHSDLPGSQLQENSRSSSSSTGPKKKNRWTDTKEKILVELFGENEDKLRYKAFSSPEWLSIARQLHSRCKEQNVDSDKTPQQWKNKLANLTKKYKNTKDKLRSTGYGGGGDVPSDKESEESEDVIPKYFNNMDEILGNRESINPRHVFESSHIPDSESPEMSELKQHILEKDGLDKEICRAAQKQRQGTPQNVSSPSECTVPPDGVESDNDQSLAFAEPLFFKSKGKNKKPLASTPVPKRCEADCRGEMVTGRTTRLAEDDPTI
ncbi:hypothetical protein P5673_012407 [Acropora cervicornis]|uniref:Myb/SANT-like DNA-binding domain-containing protein n=1 Tax=Acropora cervicornis TaxID=6130 RepID=A0AAD9V7T1_ACRCE|nr:hypothetical protein P5673_012407 [Acropora cervicornis]